MSETEKQNLFEKLQEISSIDQLNIFTQKNKVLEYLIYRGVNPKHFGYNSSNYGDMINDFTGYLEEEHYDDCSD